MAAPVNDRDVLIVNAAVRDLDPKAGKSVRIQSSALLFHVNADGTPANGPLTFTAVLSGVSGVVTWNTSGGAVLTGTADNTRTLTFANMPTDFVTITASLTIDGQLYTDTIGVTRVQDGKIGSDGKPGVSGTQYALAELYKWSSAGVMPAPTGTSVLTWSNGANTSYTGTDGWYTAGSLPENPGTSGVKLWVASRPMSAPGGTATTTVQYDVDTSVTVYSQNGAQGAAGVKSATVRAYAWATGPAPTATGTGTYTYASNDYNNLPAAGGGTTWSKTKTNAPAIGYTLYEASVSVVNTNGTASTNYDWANAVVVGIGYLGLNGTGTTGDSALISYVLATGMSLDSTPVIIVRPGRNKPATGSWGSGTNAWEDQPPTPAANQSVFQSNGIYNATTNETTWSVPYLSNLRVGVLSAISANLGAITAGSMNINNKFMVNTTGDVEARSITIKAADGTVILSSGTALNPIFAAPGTLNSDQTYDALKNRPMDPGNMVRTPTFENAVLGTWQGVPGTALLGNGAQSSNAPHKYSLLVAARDTIEPAVFPVAPGEKFYTSATVYTGNTVYSCALGLVFYNSDGQIVGFGAGGRVLGGITGWQALKGSFTVPVGASKAATWIQIDGFNNVGSVEITNMIVTRSEPGATIGATWGVNVAGSTDVDYNIAAAKSAADNARTQADAANAELALIASDNILSKGEKSKVLLEWNTIDSEKNGIWAQADQVGVNKAAYVNAVNDLSAYLVALNPNWADSRYDTVIDGATFRFRFQLVYQEKQAVLTAIAGVNNAAAAAARSAADAARNQADAANAALANIASDNVLSKGEKAQTRMEWNILSNERYNILVQADALGVDRRAYNTSVDLLADYLSNSIGPYPGAWADATVDSAIDGNVYRQKFGDVYYLRQDVLNAIAGRINQKAVDARAVADAANSVANAAKARTDSMSADGILDRTEKKALIADWDEEYKVWIQVRDQAYRLGVNYDDYDAKHNAAANYLVGLNPAWDNVNSDTLLDRAVFRNIFSAMYEARVMLQNAIAAKTATVASWAGVSGAGKPADNATVGATIGSNLAGQFNAAEVATRFIPGSITDTQIGGNLKSTNWNGQVGTGGAGWLLERSTGNFYGNSIQLRGNVSSGSIYKWEWAPQGQNGFYLGNEGFIMGDYYNGKYFQVTSDGNVYAPGFKIENGNATFSGNLSAAGGTFSGALNAASGTFKGELQAATGTIGLLRSAASGQRTEYDSNGIRVYNSAGNLILRLGVW